MLMKSAALWVAWAVAYRCKGVDVWQLKVNSSSSWAWRKVLLLRPKVQHLLARQGDKMFWEGKPMEQYSAKRVWTTLRPKCSKQEWSKLIWGKCSIPRFSFISWLIMINALTTRSKLFRWGKISDDQCLLCGFSSESREHLFFACVFVQQLVQVAGVS
ncbi:unnamed protein product [Linum trigynum]|uniref:Reverse transcriptase zinc-binding domain-containing protein n=1 Tax=Linum trigynum TaxID=586398 RepID=A0AAV2DF11_9ROSI